MKKKILQTIAFCCVIVLLFTNNSKAQTETEKDMYTKAPVELNTIEQIRQKDADNNFFYKGQVITYTGDAVITGKMYDHLNSRFIEDETGGIQLVDFDENIEAEYDLYQLINSLEKEIHITGKLGVSSDMLRLNVNEVHDVTPEEGDEPEGPEPIEPTVFSLEDIEHDGGDPSNDHQSKLVKFENVWFEGTDPGDTFVEGEDYTITDGTDDFTLRASYFYDDEDYPSYIGENIPDVAVNITGIIVQSSMTIRIRPRFAADITQAYTATFNVAGDDVGDLQNATIEIGDNELQTNEQGTVDFILESGSYDYTVTADGYNTETGTIAISGDDVVEYVTMSAIHTVTFDVKDQSAAAVADAEIIIGEASESTDGDGLATFYFDNDTYNYTVIAEGFDEATGDFEVDGQDKTVLVEMTPVYNVTFNVYEGEGGITATANGSSVSSGDKIAEGSEVIFTAAPDEGYQVKGWTKDDVSVSLAEETYTIGNLEDNVDVKVEFEEIVGVDEVSRVEVSVFPNPANDKLYVESGVQINELKFLDISGKEVYKKSVGSNSAKIDVSNLKKGVYIIQIISVKEVQSYRLQISR